MPWLGAPNRYEQCEPEVTIPPFRACVTPCEAKHIDEYMEVFKESAKCSPTGAFACDISQSRRRARRGPWLPAYTGSSVMASFSAMIPESRVYFYTDKELAFAHGFPMTPSALPLYRSCMKNDFDGMAHSCIRSALGNGMHLPIQISWFAYVLSNCVRRSSLGKVVLFHMKPTTNPIADTESEPASETESEESWSESPNTYTPLEYSPPSMEYEPESPAFEYDEEEAAETVLDPDSEEEVSQEHPEKQIEDSLVEQVFQEHPEEYVADTLVDQVDQEHPEEHVADTLVDQVSAAAHGADQSFSAVS